MGWLRDSDKQNWHFFVVEKTFHANSRSRLTSEGDVWTLVTFCAELVADLPPYGGESWHSTWRFAHGVQAELETG